MASSEHAFTPHEVRKETFNETKRDDTYLSTNVQGWKTLLLTFDAEPYVTENCTKYGTMHTGHRYLPAKDYKKMSKQLAKVVNFQDVDDPETVKYLARPFVLHEAKTQKLDEKASVHLPPNLYAKMKQLKITSVVPQKDNLYTFSLAFNPTGFEEAQNMMREVGGTHATDQLHRVLDQAKEWSDMKEPSKKNDKKLAIVKSLKTLTQYLSDHFGYGDAVTDAAVKAAIAAERTKYDLLLGKFNGLNSQLKSTVHLGNERKTEMARLQIKVEELEKTLQRVRQDRNKLRESLERANGPGRAGGGNNGLVSPN